MVSSVLFKILKLSIHAGANPIKLFFSSFSFFGVKLGLFTINYFFLYGTNLKAFQQKTEKNLP